MDEYDTLCDDIAAAEVEAADRLRRWLDARPDLTDLSRPMT